MVLVLSGGEGPSRWLVAGTGTVGVRLRFQAVRWRLFSGRKDSFDWVEARAKCNFRALFEDLRKVVEANVQSARIRVAPDVVLDEPAPRRFVVRVSFAGRPDLPGLSRSFELSEEDSEIKVFGPDSRLFFVARANLAGEDCRLEVQTCGVSPVAEPLWRSRPMALGEFSREVLESIFFRGR